MGIKSQTVPLDEQIRVVDFVMKNLRVGARAGNMIAGENYEGLKAVAAGLQARQALPRHDTLVEIEVAIERVLRSRTSLGYDDGQMIQLAQTLMRRWSTVRQALEEFGQAKVLMPVINTNGEQA